MTKDQARSIFVEYVKPTFGNVKVLSVEEKDNAFLFDFAQAEDDFPVDYPVISVNKTTGSITELKFTNAEHREIIYGD